MALRPVFIYRAAKPLSGVKNAPRSLAAMLVKTRGLALPAETVLQETTFHGKR